MESGHRIFPEASLAIIRIRGHITAEEIVKQFSALYEDDAWQPGFAMLWDATDTASLDIQPTDVSLLTELAAEVIEKIGEGKLAVAVSREIDYHLAYLLLLRQPCTHLETGIFWNMDDALAWLGAQLPPEDLPGKDG